MPLRQLTVSRMSSAARLLPQRRLEEVTPTRTALVGWARRERGHAAPRGDPLGHHDHAELEIWGSMSVGAASLVVNARAAE